MDRDRVVPAVAGVIGPIVVAGCTAATALAYRGRDGERYSPLNHWISELGEPGVSRRAAIFNAGAVAGGTCLAVFMASLARVRRGRFPAAYGPMRATPRRR